MAKTGRIQECDLVRRDRKYNAKICGEIRVSIDRFETMRERLPIGRQRRTGRGKQWSRQARDWLSKGIASFGRKGPIESSSG